MPRVIFPESFTAGTHAATPHTSAMIQDETIVNADIALAAEIAYSKLVLAGLIRDTDIKSDAAIAYSKLNLAAAIKNTDIVNSTIDLLTKGTYVPVNITGDTMTGNLLIDTVSAPQITLLEGGAGKIYLGWDTELSRFAITTANGAPTLFTGNIQLNAGKTVDGIELSTHEHSGGEGLGEKVKGIDVSILQMGAGTTDGSGDDTITFPTAFASAPKVFLQGIDAAGKGIVLDVVSVSTTQVVVKARQTSPLSDAGGHSHIAFKHTEGAWAAPGYKRTVTHGDGSAVSGTPILGGESASAGTADVNTNAVAAHTHVAAVLAIAFNWLAVLV